MKGKITFVLGAAVGYVLGARAGKARYEQIKRGAERLWNTAPVQRGADAAKEVGLARLDDVKDAAVRAGSKLFQAAAEKSQAEKGERSKTTKSGGTASGADETGDDV